MSWKGGIETVDVDGMSVDQLKADSEALTADIDVKAKRPIQIASFEC